MERKEEKEEEEEEEISLETHSSTTTTSTKRKKSSSKVKNTRRFSDEQIKLLETIFEADSKLEPRRKVQVARELGLQPRQVAIWFQNRRARWKSKQIEQDFRTLRNEYDLLESKFESLKEENKSLLMQLEKLKEMMGKPKACEAKMDEKDPRCSCNKDENLRQSEVELEQKNIITSSSEVGSDHEQFMNMCQVEAIVSPEDWHRFGSSGGGLFDPPLRSGSATSQWLNFWIN